MEDGKYLSDRKTSKAKRQAFAVLAAIASSAEIVLQVYDNISMCVLGTSSMESDENVLTYAA